MLYREPGSPDHVALHASRSNGRTPPSRGLRDFVLVVVVVCRLLKVQVKLVRCWKVDLAAQITLHCTHHAVMEEHHPRVASEILLFVDCLKSKLSWFDAGMWT